MRDRLRICYFLPESSPHSARFLDYFVERGYEVHVFSERSKMFYVWPEGKSSPDERGVSATGSDKAAFPSGLASTIFSLVAEPARRVLRNAPALVREIPLRAHYAIKKRIVRRELRQIRPQVVHGLNISGHGIEAYFAGTHPYVLSVWGCDIRTADQLKGIKKKLFRLALESADAVTGPTDDLLSQCFHFGVGPDRVHRIGMPGIDVARFADVEGTETYVREMGIPAEARLIFSPRAMEDIYRLDVIVQAMHHVRDRVPDALLLLMDYGRVGDYAEQVESRIHELELENQVFILENGPIPYDEMRYLYAASEVCVSIPVRDGLPQSMLEAFAASCAYVGSDLATYDGVLEHRETGMRVDGSDPRLVANAITELLTDSSLRSSVVSKAAARVRERGDMFKEMAQMEQLYSRLVSAQETR